MRRFKTGKIPSDILVRNVFRYKGNKDLSVILGSSIGEDAALVSLGEKILVLTTDPVTGTSSDMGWLAVHINANDVACRGAKPRWFLECRVSDDYKDGGFCSNRNCWCSIRLEYPSHGHSCSGGDSCFGGFLCLSSPSTRQGTSSCDPKPDR